MSYLDRKLIYWSLQPLEDGIPLALSVMINTFQGPSPIADSKGNEVGGLNTDLKAVQSDQIRSKHAKKVLASPDLITSIDAHPLESNLFCLGSLDKFIRVYDIEKETIVDWYQSTDFITAVTYSPDARLLVAGFSHGQCRVYTTAPTLKFRCELNCRNTNVKEINANKVINIKFLNLDEFLVASSDSRIRLFTCHNLKHSALKYKGHASNGPILKTDCDR